MNVDIKRMSDKPIKFLIPKEGETGWADPNTVHYLPHGTKILKIHPVLSEDILDQELGLILRPKNLALGGRVAGHEDKPIGKPGLLVTWGGGQVNTNGIHRTVSHHPKGFCYFNVTHLPGDDGALKSYTLTFDVLNGNGSHHSSLEIKLEPPPRSNEKFLRATSEKKPDANVFRFTGAQIPLYVARWWPTRQVHYDPIPTGWLDVLQRLEVRDYTPRERKVWVGLSAMPGHGKDVTLLEIEGELGNHQLLVEGFRFFDQKHFVLRLWFLWCNPSEGVNLDEVPDAERFDLLLDCTNRTVKYIGSDLHWREWWGKQKSASPLSAKLGMLSEPADMLDKIREWLAQTFMPGDPKKNNPTYILCGELTDGQGCYHQPPHVRKKYRAAPFWQQVPTILIAPLLDIPVQAHAPLVKFAAEPFLLWSNDVREG